MTGPLKYFRKQDIPWLALAALATLWLLAGAFSQASPDCLPLIDAEGCAAAYGITPDRGAAYVLSSPLASLVRWLVHLPGPFSIGGALVWLLLGGTCVAFVASRLRGRSLSGKERLRAAFNGFAWVLTVAWLASLAPLPGLSLSKGDPDWMVVNLHSHTLASHDGLATARENFDYHLARGYDAWAVTEHDQAGGPEIVELAAEIAPEAIVLSGQEVRGWPTSHYLFIGGTEDVPAWAMKYWPSDLIERARTLGQAVVAVKPWTRSPDPAGVRVSDHLLGGVESYNSSSPGGRYIQPDGEPCDGPGWAVLDWHGWGNSLDTWSAAKLPGWRELPKQQAEKRLLAVIRGKADAEVITFGFLPALLENSVADGLINPLIGLWHWSAYLSAGERALHLLWIIGGVLLLAAKKRRPRLHLRVNGGVIGFVAIVTGYQGVTLLLRALDAPGNEALPQAGGAALAVGLCLIVNALSRARSENAATTTIQKSEES